MQLSVWTPWASPLHDLPAASCVPQGHTASSQPSLPCREIYVLWSPSAFTDPGILCTLTLAVGDHLLSCLHSGSVAYYCLLSNTRPAPAWPHQQPSLIEYDCLHRKIPRNVKILRNKINKRYTRSGYVLIVLWDNNNNNNNVIFQEL